MGYDLKMLDGTKYLVEDWQRLRAGDPALPADLCDLARSLGDTKPYADYHDDSPRSFRIVSSAMSRLYDTMADHGMLDTSGESPEAPWPEVNGFGDTYQRLATYRHDGSVGISWWKPASNDYYIVTAEECTEALRAWLASDRRIDDGSEAGRELWDSWLGYLAVGAVTSGFYVG